MAKIKKDNKIIFFPVGNGDTTLITLEDETNILVDCNITKDSTDENVEEKYDIISYLTENLHKDEKNKVHLDVFILTHPDIDHCRNISKHFYFGDPSKLSDENEEKIIIDELWFSPDIFNEDENDLNDEAKAIKEEAERRKKLYEDNDNSSSDYGNRLRLIGATDNEELDALKDITTVAGEQVNLFNNKVEDNFSIFVLGPVKGESDDDECERNTTSIVMKLQFNIDSKDINNVVILAGDSRIENWKRILKKNSLEDLKFDIFLAPHHCSWYFFSAEDYKNKPASDDDIINFIENGKNSGDTRIIVASCKTIKRNEDNPPHYRAKNNYINAVGKDNFYCLANYPSADKQEPLSFIFTVNGPLLDEGTETKKSSSNNLYIQNVAKGPKTYGSK